MSYAERVLKILSALERCDDDAQAVEAARKLREILHQHVEEIRSIVAALKQFRTESTTSSSAKDSIVRASGREARTRI